MSVGAEERTHREKDLSGELSDDRGTGSSWCWRGQVAIADVVQEELAECAEGGEASSWWSGHPPAASDGRRDGQNDSAIVDDVAYTQPDFFGTLAWAATYGEPVKVQPGAHLSQDLTSPPGIQQVPPVARLSDPAHLSDITNQSVLPQACVGFLAPAPPQWSNVHTVKMFNVPKWFHESLLREELDGSGFEGCYGAVHTPGAHEGGSHDGYAIINFGSPEYAWWFKLNYEGRDLGEFMKEGKRVCVMPAFADGDAAAKSQAAKKNRRSRKAGSLIDLARYNARYYAEVVQAW